MKLFGPLYAMCMRWVNHRHAPRFLAGLSFAESSFFPIPPDVMLAPMAMSQPASWKKLAFITAVFSVLGGLFGYFIGAYAMTYIMDWLQTSKYWGSYQTAVSWFDEWGVAAVLIAGFSPVPYKVFTIAAGAANMALLPFVLASVVARSARFFLVAGLMAWGGPKLEASINRYIEILGWLSILIIAGVVISIS